MPTQTPAAGSAAAEANEDLPLISDEEIEAALSEIETDGAKSALEKLRSADDAATEVEDAAPSVPAGTSKSIPESPPADDAGPLDAVPADGEPTAAPGAEPRPPASEQRAETEPDAAAPAGAHADPPPPAADAALPTEAEDGATAPPSDSHADTDAAKPAAGAGGAGDAAAPSAPSASAPAPAPSAGPGASLGTGSEPTGKAGGTTAAPAGRKVQFKIGAKAAPAEPTATAKPAEAAGSPPKTTASSPEAAPPARTPTADVAPQHRASVWKRVGRALDCALDVLDWPVRLLGASGRQVVGASALSLLLLACGALALRTIFPRPDAVAFLRQKRAELTQPPKPKADSGGAQSGGATKDASTGHGGGH